MEKKLVEKIIESSSEKDIKQFDKTIGDSFVKNVSVSFTRNVMAKIQPATKTADGQIWWILLGTIITAGIWIFGGFGNAAPLELTLPKVEIPAIEIGPLIKGIGFVNIILILLLLDRYFQRRGKAA